MGLVVAAHRNASLRAMWDAFRAAYTYAETNYANPHALTGHFNGSATTTYAYDAIGNLATTTGASTSTCMWDYKDRMLRAWVSGATSTYQYDHTIARMRQVVGSTTTDYPNRFYSLATSTQSGIGTSRRARTRHCGHLARLRSNPYLPPVVRAKLKMRASLTCRLA